MKSATFQFPESFPLPSKAVRKGAKRAFFSVSNSGVGGDGQLQDELLCLTQPVAAVSTKHDRFNPH